MAVAPVHAHSPKRVVAYLSSEEKRKRREKRRENQATANKRQLCSPVLAGERRERAAAFVDGDGDDRKEACSHEGQMNLR